MFFNLKDAAHDIDKSRMRLAVAYAYITAIVDACWSSHQYNPCSKYYTFPHSIPFAHSTLKPAVHDIFPTQARGHFIGQDGDETPAANQHWIVV